MTTVRERLRKELSSKLIPALEAAGFEGPDGIRGNAVLNEFRRCMPEGETHVLSVQLEKRQLPRFIVNLYVEPPEGMDQLVARGGAVISGHLMARPGPRLSGWFRADRAWWQRVLFRQTDTLEKEAVAQCVACLPEVEQWWLRQSPSAHITSHQVIYPGTERTSTP